MRTIAYFYQDILLNREEKINVLGLEIDQIYEDFNSRIELEKLIKNCEQNPPQYLVIRYLEELGDNFNEVINNWQKIESLKIEIIVIYQSYNSSQFLNQNDQEIKKNLASIFHNIEHNQRSNNLKKGHARNRLKMLPPPGRSPYGYRRGKDKYVIDRSTAPIIKDFFERFLLFASLRDVVRYLQQKYGKKIAVTTARHWLTNPVYRGDLAYQNQEIIADTHFPIITREEGAQIDRLLQRNSCFAPRSATTSHCLAGLVFCDKCGQKMKITPVSIKHKKKKYLYLTPINCPENPRCKSINYNLILQETINNICVELPLIANNINSPSPDIFKNNFQAEINKKEEIISQLNVLLNQGILDQQTTQLRHYQLQKEIAQLKTKIAQLPPANLKAIASTVSIPEFWLDLSEIERRFYFREFIKKILVFSTTTNNLKNLSIKLVFIF